MDPNRTTSVTLPPAAQPASGPKGKGKERSKSLTRAMSHSDRVEIGTGRGLDRDQEVEMLARQEGAFTSIMLMVQSADVTR